MRISTAVLLASSIALAAAGAGTAQEPPERITSIGVVSDGQVDGDGRVWFEFDRVDQRFVIATSPDPDGLFKILSESHETGRSILVHYDPDGDFRDGGDKPTYLVRDLVYMGKTIAGEQSRPAQLDGESSATETALARAIAFYNNGEAALAHEQSALALADPALRPPLRALALKTDGHALSDDAFDRIVPGLERDRQLLAALADFRAWKTLAPDDSKADLAVESTLTALGDYDAALTLARATAVKYPKESFWPLVDIGAIHRSLKQYPQALAALDEVVAAYGPQQGMAYHYHRGWTLSEMHRYDEAVAEFTSGISGQPDYAWAFFRRGCAQAALGHLRDAVADHEQALTLLEDGAKAQPMTFGMKNDLERARAAMQQLRTALAQAPGGKLEGVCNGYSDYGDTYRDRSPLLPPSP